MKQTIKRGRADFCKVENVLYTSCDFDPNNSSCNLLYIVLKYYYYSIIALWDSIAFKFQGYC